MAKIIFRNIFISLLTSVTTVIYNLIVTAFVDGIIVGEFGHYLSITKLSPLVLLIISSSFALIGSALFMAYCRFMTGENECCKRPPLIIIGLLSIFLIFITFGGASGLFLLLYYSKISIGITSNGEEATGYKVILVALSSVTVSQICFFIGKIINGFKWQVCRRCGRMYCVKYVVDNIEEWDETRYKTSTQNENIGSISVGDRKVADITGKVTRGHYETRHYKRTNYNGRCQCCGRLVCRDILD